MRSARSLFILDDDEDFRDQLIEALAFEGFRADGSGTPCAATLERIGAADILVLDLALGERDGFDVLGALATLPRRPRIVFVSGHGESVLRAAGELARAAGLTVLGALPKPIEVADLLALTGAPDHPCAPVAPADAAMRARIRAALGAGLAAGHLPVMFQPLVAADSLAFVGAEALLGSALPGLGPVRPSDIIAAAREEAELLVALVRATLEAAADLGLRLTAAGHSGAVSVNMPIEMLHGADAAAAIHRIVTRRGLAPGRVVLELTEDALYDGSADVLAVLARLRLMGFGLALDDVGQRRSGLMQIANLPVTEIKIDLELMRNARLWGKHRHVVRSVAALGHSLGLRVVAEGVETIDDLARARLYGIDDVQGFLISPKRSADDLMTMLARWSDVTAPVMEAGAGQSGS